MRKLIISFCILLSSLSIQAQSLNGIRIESEGHPMIVYLNNQPVSTPTGSCFIANLNSGNYTVEVYDAWLPTHPSPMDKKKHIVYNESVRYRGRGIHDIYVRLNDHGSPHHDAIMPPDVFEIFLKNIKQKPFDSERNKMIDNISITSEFSSEQCRQIINCYTFDSEKVKGMQKIYPKIVDKQNFFMVIETLTFQTEKDKINKFIKQYHEKENHR